MKCTILSAYEGSRTALNASTLTYARELAQSLKGDVWIAYALNCEWEGGRIVDAAGMEVSNSKIEKVK